MQVFTLTRGGCDNHRCHDKNPRWIMRLGCRWCHARKRRAGNFGDFWKSSYLRFEPRRVQLGLGGAPRVVGSDGTVSIVNTVSLSPRVENLKVKKVIKVSYLNYRESTVFRDSYACERFTYLNVLRIRIIAMLHLFCQILPCPRCVWKIHGVWLTQFSRIFY